MHSGLGSWHVELWFVMNSFRSFQAFRNGGANEDIADWITGDVPRASKKAADEI